MENTSVSYSLLEKPKKQEPQQQQDQQRRQQQQDYREQQKNKYHNKEIDYQLKLPTAAKYQKNVPSATTTIQQSFETKRGDDTTIMLLREKCSSSEQRTNIRTASHNIEGMEKFQKSIETTVDNTECSFSSSCSSHSSKVDKQQHSNSNSHDKEQEQEQKYQRQRRQRNLMLHIQLLEHASYCHCNKNSFRPCKVSKCSKMKGFIQHIHICRLKVGGGCNTCKRMWTLLRTHAQKCKEDICPVPQCIAIRKKMSRMKAEQQDEIHNKKHHQQQQQPKPHHENIHRNLKQQQELVSIVTMEMDEDESNFK